MKKLSLFFLLPVLALFIWLLPDEHHFYPSVRSLLGLAWPEQVTPEDLRSKYQAGKLKVLVVPGHDLEYTGASFGGVSENELTLELAEKLYQYFIEDSKFQFFTTRDFATGKYLPVFSNYFEKERAAITSFRTKLREEFLGLVSANEVEERSFIEHNFAPTEVGLRLYGINKWANEQGIDLVIHLHFNDYAGRRLSGPGRHSGFAVYLPERQYPNARASAVLGQAVFNELKQSFPVSSLPLESAGLLEDQDLIAIGSNASREGASLLVEYGYIYEPQFINEAVREKIIPELAWQTYAGLKNYFEPKASLAETTLLPREFRSPLVEGVRGNPEVLSLQRVLYEEKFYPPTGKSLSDCPLIGNFGPCTKIALISFQQKHGLSSEDGVVGPKTRAKLNELYGSAS